MADLDDAQRKAIRDYLDERNRDFSAIQENKIREIIEARENEREVKSTRRMQFIAAIGGVSLLAAGVSAYQGVIATAERTADKTAKDLIENAHYVDELQKEALKSIVDAKDAIGISTGIVESNVMLTKAALTKISATLEMFEKAEETLKVLQTLKESKAEIVKAIVADSAFTASIDEAIQGAARCSRLAECPSLRSRTCGTRHPVRHHATVHRASLLQEGLSQREVRQRQSVGAPVGFTSALHP